MGAPPTILMVLLNVMQLHIKMLQLPKKGKSSGKTVKNRLFEYEVGTEYEGFGSNWVWRCIY